MVKHLSANMFSHMYKAKCICVGIRDPLARARNNLKGMIYASLIHSANFIMMHLDYLWELIFYTQYPENIETYGSLS